MPVFSPLHPPRNPDECAPWLYEALQRLNRAATNNYQATAAVVRGETPDSSGAPLNVDTTKFFYKPGLAGGQTAYGGSNASDALTLSSTASTTKGKIYLGSGSAYDESLGLLGVGTTSPAAVAELHGQLPSNYTLYVPTSLKSASGGYTKQDGVTTTTLWDVVDETNPDDTDYIQDNGGISGALQLGLPNITPPASTAEVWLVWRIGWTGTSNALAQNAGMLLINSVGVQMASGFIADWIPHSITGSVAFRTYYARVPSSVIATMNATPSQWNGCYFQWTFAGGGVGYSGQIKVSYLQVRIYGAGASANRLALYDLNENLASYATPTGMFNIITDTASGQTENALSVTSRAGTSLGGFAANGSPFYVSGAAAGSWWQCQSTAGNGAWVVRGILSATSDTNVLLTLGGFPTFALLANASITASWSGTLSVARGGTGAGSLAGLTQVGTRSNLTAQTASIAAQTILTGGAGTAGMYRISVYVKTTTAGAALDVVKATIAWNDGTAQTLDVPFENATVIFNNHDLATLNAFSQGSIVVNAAASQNISYTTTVTKTGTPQYEIHVRIEALG